MYFREWNVLYFEWILLMFILKCPIDNNPVRNKRQAIIWTNADPVHWHLYTALGGDELSPLSPRHSMVSAVISPGSRKTWGAANDITKYKATDKSIRTSQFTMRQHQSC